MGWDDFEPYNLKKKFSDVAEEFNLHLLMNGYYIVSSIPLFSPNHVPVLNKILCSFHTLIR